MNKKYYITTPIYYPSAKPHMGHAYSSIIADFFARFKKIDGYEVHFLTGTDEHGLKIQRSAEKQKIAPLDFCNQISKTFRDLSKTLNLTNTDFIRTTEARHKKSVQYLWNELEKNDDIYLSKYSGWYSVSDEAFYAEDEIEDIDGKKRSVSSKSSVEWIEEESYFFRLSKWEKPLLDYYASHPDFISPESRKNEVISFVKSGLKDLSVSRKSFSWGIEVPNNKDHVIYVWLDALTNYISALNYPNTKDKLFEKFWPASVHLIGKDILRFHAVYWPAFLLAAKIELPSKVYGHGWILSDNEKMSKSKGNILDPIEIINQYGLDPLRYYLIKEVSFGNDGNISQDRLEDCINSDLANNFGNLCQRVTAFAIKNCKSLIPEDIDFQKEDMEILNKYKNNLTTIRKKIDEQDINFYIDFIVNSLFEANKYFNDQEPWKKKNDIIRLNTIVYSTLEIVRKICLLLYPIIPESSLKALKIFNLNENDIILSSVENNEFLIKGTKEKLLKKTKQRLLNIAKKDLNIELDPSMKKNEMVEKIYVYYHNLKNEDTKEDKKEKRMGTEPVNLNEDLYDY
ncbi:MAG: methionine--tRNA ligase [Flavobacteriaceae bacterium]|nr:methionine--tRNA ligase [Flavobacteriaceae bacterium]